MDLACFMQRSTSNERLAALKRQTGRRMGKQLLRIAGYATGWIVSGLSPTPSGRRNFMKNDPGSSVFSMSWERFSTLFLFA